MRIPAKTLTQTYRCGLDPLHKKIKNRCKKVSVKNELEFRRLALWLTESEI